MGHGNEVVTVLPVLFFSYWVLI